MNKLQLLNLFFPKFTFSQLHSKEKQQINLKIQVDYEFAKANDNQTIKATINTSVKDEEVGRVKLEITTVGIFTMPDDFDEKVKQYSNFIANIMWPYVRSQVSLITIQPNFNPIMLPLVAPPVQVKSTKEEIN